MKAITKKANAATIRMARKATPGEAAVSSGGGVVPCGVGLLGGEAVGITVGVTVALAVGPGVGVGVAAKARP
jgi:hypothetical protein